MKYTVHIYDNIINKRRKAHIGRFEIYDETGEFITGSGKRRIQNYNPSKKDSVPLKIIHSKVGEDKKLSVVKIERAAAGNELDYILERVINSSIFEVSCV